MNVRNKSLCAAGVFLLIQLGFIAFLGALLKSAEGELTRESRARAAVSEVMRSYQCATKAALAIYLIRATDSSWAKRWYADATKGIIDTQLTMHALVPAHEGERFKAIDNYSSFVLETLENFRKVNLSDAQPGELISVRSKLLNGLGSLERFTDEQRQLLLKTSKMSQREIALTALWVGVPLNVIAVVFLVMLFSRNISDRIKVVADNSVRLAAGAPLEPPLEGDDEIRDLDITFRDMAKALDEARAREQAVIENAIDVICTIDREGKFQSINPSSERAWGYTQEDLRGRRIASILVDEDIASTNTLLASLVEGNDVKPFENRIKRPDGSLAHALWSIRFRKADQTMFCVVHDISERKAVERLKEEFVAMISHDLRTPLSTMQFTLMMAQSGTWGALNEKGNARITSALSSAERLLSLINQLMDVQKLESGMMEIDRQEIELTPIMEKCSSSLLGFAEKHGVSLVFEPTQLIAFVDADRIVQVIVNLVSNAVKFSPKGGTVTVRATELEDVVEISVIDQGRGVPEHLQQTIFERFKQVTRTDSTEKTGTGLGLAICKALVEAHGGTIGVLSQPGEGSIFWFRLPKF